MQTVGNVLAHYGVKGMRWGVRKDRSAVDVIANTQPGRRVKTSGGQYHMPSEDAIRVAIARQKAKKSSVDALSNKELQDVVNRMNLEQNFARLNDNGPGVLATGKKLAKTVLGLSSNEHLDAAGAAVTAKTGNSALGNNVSTGLKVAKAVSNAGGGGGKKKKK